MYHSWAPQPHFRDEQQWCKQWEGDLAFPIVMANADATSVSKAELDLI